MLYGIDLAKKEIAKASRAVVVEGYTDVMACHLAGVTTAIATCGTAFGGDHIKILRRLLMDNGTRRGDLHLRRRRGRPEGGAARLRGRPEVRRRDLHRDRARRHGPLRTAPRQGRRRRSPTWSNRRTPLFEFALRQIVAALRPGDPGGPRGRAGRGRPDRRPHQEQRRPARGRRAARRHARHPRHRSSSSSGSPSSPAGPATAAARGPAPAGRQRRPQPYAADRTRAPAGPARPGA